MKMKVGFLLNFLFKLGLGFQPFLFSAWGLSDPVTFLESSLALNTHNALYYFYIPPLRFHLISV